MPSAHEHFSEQFQKWEKRGRGWQVFAEPVYPEPPFVPFTWRSMAETPAVDNGRRPSFLGSLFRKVAAPPPQPVEPELEDEPEANPLVRDSLVELQVTLPAELDMGRDSFEQLFRNLSLCHEPIAFELVGTHKRVVAQFAACDEDASLVRKQLSAYFPEVSFREQAGTLEQAWTDSEGDDIYAVEFGLEREFMLPLASGKLDPFIGIVSALAELQAKELAVFQVLWQPVNDLWAENIVNSVTSPDGKPWFVNAPELTHAAEVKAAKPLYAVIVRMLVRTATPRRLQEIARELAGSLRGFANPQGNALIPLHNDDYPFDEHVVDVIFRQSRRTGMILSSDELFGFVHLPAEAVRTKELLRDWGRTKAAPDTGPSGLLIGDNEHHGITVPVYLAPDQRVRHTHIIGIPGTGKSSLLFNLIRQDIENGAGVAVLDPHGDLIDQLCGIIPEDRIDDVVLVDLSDTGYPVGFNILQAHSEDEKALLASDLVSVFRRFSTSWGDQMDIVLQNAILVFLESTQGGTLADLRRFLLEPAFQNQFLHTVTDPELNYYWQKVFPKLGGGKSIGSVLTRLQDFFSRKPLRNMVSQRENKLDFAEIMDSGKIFLAKLPEGLNGAENVHLLGSLLVSKFQQTAMSRQSQELGTRRDFWLYIDEFDHFISPSMAAILTGARKYRLGLTLGHQELHQLQSEPKVASAVTASVCTRIVLRVGDDDAKKLADGFESFDAKSLKNLEKYHAIARIERNDWDFNLALRKPELPDQAGSRKAEVIAASRAKYGTPRAEVEAAWLAGLGLKPVPANEPPEGVPKPTPSAPVEPTPSPIVVAETPKPSALPNASEIPKPAGLPAIIEIKPPAVAETPQIIPDSNRAKELPDLGRGRALHKSIQKRVEEAARNLGFKSDVEKQLAKGSNQAADLVLQRGHVIIAVEIAIGCTVDHEFGNVQKCLDAGFERIAILATGRKRLADIADAVLAGLGSAIAGKVSYHTPDEFMAELQKLAATSEQPPASKPMAAKDKRGGFEIERHFPQHSPEEQRLKQQAIYEVTKKAMKP